MGGPEDVQSLESCLGWTVAWDRNLGLAFAGTGDVVGRLTAYGGRLRWFILGFRGETWAQIGSTELLADIETKLGELYGDVSSDPFGSNDLHQRRLGRD